MIKILSRSQLLFGSSGRLHIGRVQLSHPRSSPLLTKTDNTARYYQHLQTRRNNHARRQINMATEQEYTIRLATPSDLQAIHAIELDAIMKFLEIPELADLATKAQSSATMGRVTQEQYDEWLSLGRVYLACNNGGEAVSTRE